TRASPLTPHATDVGHLRGAHGATSRSTNVGSKLFSSAARLRLVPPHVRSKVPTRPRDAAPGAPTRDGRRPAVSSPRRVDVNPQAHAPPRVVGDARLARLLALWVARGELAHEPRRPVRRLAQLFHPDLEPQPMG